MQDRPSIAALRHLRAHTGAPLRVAGSVLSVLLGLALLAQGAVLVTHSHLDSPTPDSVAEVAWSDGAIPATDREPADPDAAACDVCGTLSKARAIGVPPSPVAWCAPSGASLDLARVSEAAPREPAPTGTGSRSPPSSLV